MAENDKRGGDRVSAALRLRLRYTNVESFIDRYAANVSKGGIFIASRAPKPVGSVLRFEFQLADGSPVVRGEGKVVWIKEFDPTQPQKPHGMGVKFMRLDSQSKAVLDRMLAIKGQTRAEGSGMSTLPGEASGMIPLPTQGSGARPLPPEGSGARPLPPEGSGARPLPPEGSGARPLPPEGSGAPPAPPEGTDVRPLPPRGSGPRPAPPEESGVRPAPTEGSGAPPAPPEGSGALAAASARPVPSIDLGLAMPIMPALQPALDELDALAREIRFTDEALIAAVTRAHEFAAGAKGDLESLLAEVGAGVGAVVTSPGPPSRGHDGQQRELDVVSPAGDAAPGPPDGPTGGPRRGRLGDVVKKIFRK